MTWHGMEWNGTERNGTERMDGWMDGWWRGFSLHVKVIFSVQFLHTSPFWAFPWVSHTRTFGHVLSKIHPKVWWLMMLTDLHHFCHPLLLIDLSTPISSPSTKQFLQRIFGVLSWLVSFGWHLVEFWRLFPGQHLGVRAAPHTDAGGTQWSVEAEVP